MKYRKLRIAWSVAWGIVAVLLVALWVRSCSTFDSVGVPLPYYWNFAIASPPGACGLIIFKGYGSGWHWNTLTTSDFRQVTPRNGANYSGICGRFAYLNEAGPGVVLPDWFLIAVALALSAAPWLRWSNRFSLRTLLITMTLVAIALGLIVWLSPRPLASPSIDQADLPVF